MNLEVCANCKALILDSSALNCDWCASILSRESMAEEDFLPIKLGLSINKRLYPNTPEVCEVTLYNKDGDTLRNVALEIKSGYLKDITCTRNFPSVRRGLMANKSEPFQIEFKNYGTILLDIALKYMDARGHQRSYFGNLKMKIAELQAAGQPIQVSIYNNNAEGAAQTVDVKFSEEMMRKAIPESATDSEDIAHYDIELSLDLEKFVRKQPQNKETTPRPKSDPGLEDFSSDITRFCLKEKKENRKILLLTGKHLTIGRDSFERRPDIDLTLRLIPARDPQADPEGEINRLISREQARIEPVEDHFVIHNIGSQRFEIAGLELPDIFAPLDASEESDTGQSSDGAQDGGQAASFLSDRIQMIPHDEDRKHQPITLRIDQSARLPYFCEIRFAKGALRLRVQTYYSSRYGLQALGLRRMNNFEKLEYIWVRRSCYIGGSEGCPIRVESGRLPDKAAVLEWRDGYFALRAGIDKLPVKLDGVPLEKRQVAAIERPCLLQIGDYSWQIDKAQKSDFTDI